MGIKGFSKTFEPIIIKQNDLKGLTGVIDASVILYQSCLGMSSVSGLTDSLGTPTLHINVIISKVLNFIKSNITQIWVLDFHDDDYKNSDKEIELLKRRKRKDEAAEKIITLKKLQATNSQSTKDLFSDDSDSELNNLDDLKDLDMSVKNNQIELICKTKSLIDSDQIEKKINQQEKITFSVTTQIVNDLKFILNSFDIMWCIAPRGFEAEHVCADLTKIINNSSLNSLKCDFVYSTDVDALLYGAKQLVRSVKVKAKKILQSYTLNTLLEENKINQYDLIKIGIVLGSDHAHKTPNVGPKTVLKKINNINLTEEQTKATGVFNKVLNIDEIKFHNLKDFAVQNNSDLKDFAVQNNLISFNSDKINTLLDWLESKNFNRDRIMKQIKSV